MTRASPRRQGTCDATALRSAAATTARQADSSTTARNAWFDASLQSCGLRARCHAARSARCARYRRRPPLRATSRLSVDGARPNRRARTRSDSPAATPREISSRSTRDKCRTDRCRTAGRTPPEASTNARIDPADLPSRRPIDRFDSPACRRSHTSTRSESVNTATTTSSMRNHSSHRECCVHPQRPQAICSADTRESTCRVSAQKAPRFALNAWRIAGRRLGESDAVDWFRGWLTPLRSQPTSHDIKRPATRHFATPTAHPSMPKHRRLPSAGGGVVGVAESGSIATVLR